MNIVKSSVCGTLESGDILIKITPSDSKKIEVLINSTVEKRFGEKIHSSILETVNNLSVNSVLIEVDDKGALDCIIKARVETALLRASDQTEIKLGVK